MPIIKVTADMSRFNEALRRIIIERKKVASKELAKRVVQVLIGAKGSDGAIQLTPKATAARIKKDLNKTYHVAGRLRRSKSGKVTGSGSNVKLLWILASKLITKQGGGKGLSFEAYRARVSQVATAIAAARDKSRAFLAAGWLNCVRQVASASGIPMSGKAKGGVKLYPEKRGGKSFAAISNNGFTIACYNAAANPGTAAGNIVENALNQGIANQTRDMEQHLQDMLEKSAQKIAATV